MGSGESDLGKLLKRMEPSLLEGKYYFASVGENQLMAISSYLGSIVDVFREQEGLSIVFSEDVKDGIAEISNKEIIGPFALITLTVHSDLYAVGLLAKITSALAKEGISVNAFSAYYHDHLFVPYDKKEDAMAALANI
jgi:uncharacterized protein